MADDVKTAVEEVQQSWEDFKTENNKAMEAKADKGYVDSHVEDKLKKMNAALDSKIEEAKKAQAEVEKKLNRLHFSGATAHGADKARKMVEEWRKFSVVLSKAKGQAESAELFEEDEAKTKYGAGFANYLRHGDRSQGAISRIGPENYSALEVGEWPKGGFFAPPHRSDKVVELIYETSPMREIADHETISRSSFQGMRDLDEASSGGWVGEMQPRNDTDEPEVGDFEIPVHEQYAQPKITQIMLQDSAFDVESWLDRKVAGKFSRVENTAFVVGNGFKKPRGFLTYPAGVPSASDFDKIEQVHTGVNGGFAAAPNAGDALIDLTFKLKRVLRNGAVFVMNRATVGEVRKLKDGDGNYLWQPDFTNLQQNRIIGFPLRELEDMPDIAANSLSIGFGNFMEGYLIVEHPGFVVLRDPLTDKRFIKFYTTRRIGGDVVNFEAIKLLRFAA